MRSIASNRSHCSPLFLRPWPAVLQDTIRLQKARQIAPHGKLCYTRVPQAHLSFQQHLSASLLFLILLLMHDQHDDRSEAGTFSSSAASASCSDCPEGYYMPKEGASDCAR